MGDYSASRLTEGTGTGALFLFLLGASWAVSYFFRDGMGLDGMMDADLV